MSTIVHAVSLVGLTISVLMYANAPKAGTGWTVMTLSQMALWAFIGTFI